MRYKLSKKTEKFRKNQVEARKRAIQERIAPDYPEAIDHHDYYDILTITRHAPYGIKEYKIVLHMSPKRIDCVNVKKNGLVVMGDNQRPKQMGMYRVMILIAKLLGRRGRMD